MEAREHLHPPGKACDDDDLVDTKQIHANNIHLYANKKKKRTHR